jgi:hypothetical protein
MFYFFNRSEATQSFKWRERDSKLWLVVRVLVNVWMLTVKFLSEHLMIKFDDFVTEHMILNPIQYQNL